MVVSNNFSLNRCRGVAQPGSALAWGVRGRMFESSRPDQFYYFKNIC